MVEQSCPESANLGLNQKICGDNGNDDDYSDGPNTSGCF